MHVPMAISRVDYSGKLCNVMDEGVHPTYPTRRVPSTGAYFFCSNPTRRLMHVPFVYVRLHKYHHFYKSPEPFDDLVGCLVTNSILV